MSAVSKAVTPARSNAPKSSTAFCPCVRSLRASPRWPPLSCQHPFTTRDTSRPGASSARASKGPAGDSAGGAMVHSRNVYTQAIFSLKGKPLNCFGLKRDALYRNTELYNIMRALGVEDGLDGLRYNKVILATDADVDGMHIRNLLLTFFLHFFEPLVDKGHVYILETPLFRVRNKKNTRYCYSDQERDEAVGEIKSAEITRFKGLGEISPKEFGQFIGEGMRLQSVSVGRHSEIEKTLEFFMGKNTPARRDFIVDNLLTDVA